MNREEAIEQLKDMLRDYRVGGPLKDTQALEYAVNELERTAQEVPVQEQYVNFKNLPKERIFIDTIY